MRGSTGVYKQRHRGLRIASIELRAGRRRQTWTRRKASMVISVLDTVRGISQRLARKERLNYDDFLYVCQQMRKKQETGTEGARKAAKSYRNLFR